MLSKEKLLHTDIFETLRDRIVYGEYPAGMALTEKELCREFSVSRTPLREAIQRLEAMKLVTVIPRYGTNVAPIDINEIRCAFEVKVKLEGLAGELAARRICADKLRLMETVIHQVARLQKKGGLARHRQLIEIEGRFHRIILEAAENPILQEFLDNLHFRCARLWNSSLSEVVLNDDIFDQLNNVYQALKKGDTGQARHHMEYHVQYFIDKIRMRLL